MKKKISALLVILILAVSLVSAGCGNDNAAAQQDVKIISASSKAAQAESAGKEASGKAAQSGDEASAKASDKSTAEAAEDPSGSDSAEASQKSSEKSTGNASKQSSEKSAGNASQESSAETAAFSASAAEQSSEVESQQSAAGSGQEAGGSEKASAADSGSGNSGAAKESSESPEKGSGGSGDEDALTVSEDGEYTDKEHVALYIHEFGHLPSNYVTKNEAMDAGWNNREGNLNTVLPGMSIGGDKFGNYEGRLPKANGRKYYECDIDFNPDGQASRPVYRNEKRIIYSNDGLVFYTEDHYETFEQLY